MLSLKTLLNALFSGPKPVEYIVTLEYPDSGLVCVQHYHPIVWDKIKNTLDEAFNIINIQEIY
jgi:prolyl-tRNA synthetase